jgi:predicted phage terminase large subunit-like protein
LKLPSLEELVAEQSRRSFYEFFKEFAWPVLQPGTPYSDNWHIQAICEHLEAVSRGEIKRLIINLPFRLLKSSIVSQAWPAWDWIDNPSKQFLTASYAKDVATRDAVNSRRIIDSDRYRAAWGDRFKLTTDQDTKQRYDNDKMGTRTISSTDGAATGFGGDRIILDDPISAKEADSEIARLASIEFYKGTIATRLNNAQEGAIVLVHQRLNEGDLTGYLLKEEVGIWEHLILPMRYKKEYAKTTCLGYQDPRTKEGELIHPERLNETTISKMEITLGSFHTAAQLAQRPTTRGGVIIKGEWYKRYQVLPPIRYRNIYADTAQKTKERNDYSVFECWGHGYDGNIYLIDLIRGKWEAPELLKRARDFWAKHKGMESQLSLPVIGSLRKAKIEDKSSGTGLIQQLMTGDATHAKIPVDAIQRSTDKLIRVGDGLPHIEAGFVWIPEEAPWVADFISENEAFTNNDSHPHDDQIDPEMDAIADMLGTPNVLDMWAKLGK